MTKEAKLKAILTRMEEIKEDFAEVTDEYDADYADDQTMNLSEIFETEPRQWGFRGDPYFWRYLKEKAREMPITISEAELEDWIPLLVSRLQANENTF